MKDKHHFLIWLGFIVMLGGCSGLETRRMKELPFVTPKQEADWIRNGEPIEFEQELWYPQDNIEMLTDEEVILMGEYRDVQVFVDKIDVRPFEQIYTKFGLNKFREYYQRPPMRMDYPAGVKKQRFMQFRHFGF